jgi:hypothetical protein
VDRHAGKTALCAGLAINFLNSGKSAGYFKYPAPDSDNDSDTVFLQKIVGKEHQKQERDVVLYESALGPRVEETKKVLGAVKEMKARVIVLEAFTGRDSIYLETYKWFDKSLLGVVINKVPASQVKSVRERAGQRLAAAGLKLLGVIPESRTLLAVTIGELAEIVKGQVLTNTEKSDELVENYMLGAMVVGSGIDYFARKNSKAAIIRAGRPDMQLAALETPTRCLVLAGGSQPIDTVLQKAAARAVPVITTEWGTDEIIDGIEKALAAGSLRQEKKLAGLGELVKSNVDLKTIV